MPNHFTTTALLMGGYGLREEDFNDKELCDLCFPAPTEALGDINSGFIVIDGEEFRYWDSNGGLSGDRIAELVANYGAASLLDWNRRFWGTKWGTYDTRLISLGGDGCPMVLKFNSAWGPPNPICMYMIDDYLRERMVVARYACGDPVECLEGQKAACQIRWMGLEPSDGSICEIEIASEEDISEVRDIIDHFRSARKSREGE